MKALKHIKQAGGRLFLFVSMIGTVAILFLQTPVSAQTRIRIDLLPYGAFINYDNALSKEFSAVGGLYGYVGLGLQHSLEADLGFNRIDYGDATFIRGNGRQSRQSVTIDQVDATLVYSNYSRQNLRLRVGTHAIYSGDSQTNNGYLIFGGIQRYRKYQYTASLDVYASFYNDYLPALRVFQYTGKFGFYFGNYFTYGRFYSQTTAHHIQLSENIGIADKKFSSVEQSLSFYRGNLTLEGFFWTGYQVFGVQKDGFVVFNLSERHLGAIGGSVKYGLTPRTSTRLSISRGRFKEISADQVSKSYIFLLTFGMTI